MTINPDVGLKIDCRPIENANLYELLHVLRPIILQRESCSFLKIRGLILRKFANDTLTAQFKTLLRLYEDGELSFYMIIDLAGFRKPLLSSKTLYLWLNAEEYHTDVEKSKEWRELCDYISNESSRAVVISLLHSKVKAILMLDDICEKVINAASAA